MNTSTLAQKALQVMLTISVAAVVVGFATYQKFPSPEMGTSIEKVMEEFGNPLMTETNRTARPNTAYVYWDPEYPDKTLLAKDLPAVQDTRISYSCGLFATGVAVMYFEDGRLTRLFYGGT